MLIYCIFKCTEIVIKQHTIRNCNEVSQTSKKLSEQFSIYAWRLYPHQGLFTHTKASLPTSRPLYPHKGLFTYIKASLPTTRPLYPHQGLSTHIKASLPTSKPLYPHQGLFTYIKASLLVGLQQWNSPYNFILAFIYIDWGKNFTIKRLFPEVIWSYVITLKHRNFMYTFIDVSVYCTEIFINLILKMAHQPPLRPTSHRLGPPATAQAYHAATARAHQPPLKLTRWW